MPFDSFFQIYESMLLVFLDSWTQKEDSVPFLSSESLDIVYNAYYVFLLHRQRLAQWFDSVVCKDLDTLEYDECPHIALCSFPIYDV